MLVQLSINENPLGASRLAIERVAGQMFGMNRYPFHNALEAALSKHHDVPEETIFIGTGSSEILKLLVLAAFYEQTSGNTVTGFPSYPSIPWDTERLNRQVKRVPLTADWRLDLPAMRDAIDSDTRLISICNPNNPTGQMLDPDELASFVRSVPEEVLVCVDGAYIHFSESYTSAIPLTKEVSNLLISRTFSKAYGLGGVRVGYGIANPELLDRMRRFGIDMLNKNTLSIAAALGALEDQQHVRRTVQMVNAGKDYLYKELTAMGYEPIRTQTISVPVRVGDNVQTILQRLSERKVQVSPAFDMNGYLRISVGLPRENEAFISAFKSVQTTL
jgi:histidinol-phosphate aminotransferase